MNGNSTVTRLVGVRLRAESDLCLACRLHSSQWALISESVRRSSTNATGFHGTSFPRSILATMSATRRACRRGCHEDATRKLLSWNLGLTQRDSSVASSNENAKHTESSQNKEHAARSENVEKPLSQHALHACSCRGFTCMKSMQLYCIVKQLHTKPRH